MQICCDSFSDYDSDYKPPLKKRTKCLKSENRLGQKFKKQTVKQSRLSIHANAQSMILPITEQPSPASPTGDLPTKHRSVLLLHDSYKFSKVDSTQSLIANEWIHVNIIYKN